MYKTTQNNPAGFQKVNAITLFELLKKIVKLFLNSEYRFAVNIFISGFLNYLSVLLQSNKVYCNLCHLSSPYFLHTANRKKIIYYSICPNCSSRKRHRGLYELYIYILKNTTSPKILHFAPEPVYYDLFKPYDYSTADLNLEDVDLKLDIQKIDFAANSFDLILCNHVLEHILDDGKALYELNRILRSNGLVIITVPGDWDMVKTIEYKNPDSNGHHRQYGYGFLEILRKIFFKVEYIDLYKYNDVYKLPLGLTCNHDLAFLCYKK